jgi:hypothetical protein
MGKMDSNIDTADTVWAFSHRPFGIDRQAVSANTVPPAELSDEVADTTGYRAHEQFNRTHSGILPSVLQRLIRHDSMFAAQDVVSSPAVKRCREFHVSPRARNLAATNI